jgi:hypothetical protein
MKRERLPDFPSAKQVKDGYLGNWYLSNSIGSPIN